MFHFPLISLTIFFFVSCTLLHFLIGILEFQFSVVFENVDNSSKSVDEKGKLIMREQLVTFRVEVEDIPIYVNENIIDFRCILYDRIYRKKIEIFNRSKTTCKIDFKIPKIFSKYIEISPENVFVQARDSQVVNIKMSPSVSMMEDLAYFSVLLEGFSNSASLSLPIDIQVFLSFIFYFLFFILFGNFFFGLICFDFCHFSEMNYSILK
jgi:hypothetical protein